jgi:thiamine pyrophosphate-dependent acetolactate synthase large subunit-like protein
VNVSEVVGRTLVRAGVYQVFGVVGSGNFEVTNAMIAEGARFVAARHETGAATMADAYARTGGGVAAVSLHQGCGLTNALTGITEAAKSRTPVIVAVAESTDRRSNFYVDQPAITEAIGAVSMRVERGETAAETAWKAAETAIEQRRTVVLNLPVGVQAETVGDEFSSSPTAAVSPTPTNAHHAGPLDRLTQDLRTADRPVFIAGRGGRVPGARQAIAELAQSCGALLATSAVAKGLFTDNPWSLDVSGGFSSPTAAELIRGADLIVGWGCALNMWTMRHGKLIADDAIVVQIDDTPEAIGAYRQLTYGVVADVVDAARACQKNLDNSARTGYRTEQVRQRIDAAPRWRDIPYHDTSTNARIDPRTLTIALDDLLPSERIVSIDSGNFMGYPSMYLQVPDKNGFCFTQAFQSIGLGLATAIGAALAQPDRIPVAAVGDGGFLMSTPELDTIMRLKLGMLVIVYNNHAYSAEVHHFQPAGHDLSSVQFPDTDIAAIAAGYGFQTCIIRTIDDIVPIREWVNGPRDRPFLVDARVRADEPAWWLAEAFGH